MEHDPCDDVIAFKENVLDVISKVGLFKSDTKEVQTVAECLRAVEALSPVAPQPKTGHWIRVDKDKLRCSECEVIHLIAQYPNGKVDWCPNCGAKMVEPQKSEDKE